MIRSLRQLVRSVRLGIALGRLERAERAGAAICLHSSFCAAAGSGWWVAIVRPAGWRGAPLGRPVVGRDLVQVLRRAEEHARSEGPTCAEEDHEQR